MGKKRHRYGKRILAMLMVLIMSFAAPNVSEVSSTVQRPSRHSQSDTSYRGWITIDENMFVATSSAAQMTVKEGCPEITEETALLKPGDSVDVEITIPETGDYAVVLEYKMIDGRLLDSTAEVTVAEHTVLTGVYGLWQDATKEYALDRYGNEVTPEQVLLDEYVQDYVRNSKSMDKEAIHYALSAGSVTVTVKNLDQAFYLRRVRIARISTIPYYKDYLSAQRSMSPAAEIITIQAEDYAVKSDSYIRVKSQQNASVTPYSPYQKLENTIDVNSYDSVGQRVVWNIDVPYDGWYHLAFHYSQPNKEGQSVYRDIEIDGKVPFRQLKEVAFPYTGNGYENKVVEIDGEAVKIYLTAGKHTLGLYTQAPSTQAALEEISRIISEISDISLRLQQVAGSKADKNRTWDIETYVPGVVGQLRSLEDSLLTLYEEMGRQAGTTPASCLNLKMAAGIIGRALKKPEKLPSNVSKLSIGTNSVTELIATLQNEIREQGIALDSFYLYGEKNTLPKASAGFFTSTVMGVKRFFYALTHRDISYSAGTVEKDVLNVWVNRSITHVETLQMLTDSYFVPETGIKVQCSVMPDANKLILANASDTCPDVALGVPSDTPYRLGIRGAAADLSQFEDFSKVAEKNFYKADLEPYIYDGKLYGLPETMQFYVLLYRKDILSSLDLMVPKTWNDVAQIMPVLHRNGMNFYLPLSGYTGTKGLPGILPFFFQSGASLYSEDGFTAAFNSENGISAFETLTDLYTLYSVQNNMPSFYNNFRYGTAPIGVGNFSNYIQILYAAPEIADLWGIAPSPGTADAQGNINQQQTSADRGVMIMQDSEMKEEAWTFVKWWLSDDIQTEFGQTMLTKFGSEFVWNSANKEAFSKLSIPSKDRAVILEQWSYAQNYRNLPVTYMLERSLSDAWYAAVERKVPARIALNEAVVTVNMELQVKMKEFGYLDEKGQILRAYDMRGVDAILKGGEKQ